VKGDYSFQPPVLYTWTNNDVLPATDFKISFFFLSFVVKMETNFSKNIGQGNLSSKFGRRIFENNSSIVSRLHSRILTGRGLQIEVYHNLGYGLHLVWETKN
jgi:hypothetical protein